jgi:uncharacterized protein YidB (DUF937 family)
MGASMLIEKLNLNMEPDAMVQALSGLLEGSDGSVDIAGLAKRMASNGDFSSLLDSWLGDGANSPISADSVLSLFGQGSVDAFSQAVGTSSSAAAGGLADVLPGMIDQGSPGGKLLDQPGGADALAGLAKSFFK